MFPPSHGEPSIFYNCTLAKLEMSESKVFEVLASLDPTKAIGPDGVGPNLFKYCSIDICGPLCYLFSLCLSQHNIPSEW